MISNLSVSSETKDGRILELEEISNINLKIFEEITVTGTSLSFFNNEILNSEHEEYLYGYFNILLQHLSEPKRKIICFYLREGCRINGSDFVTWTIARNKNAWITHIVIESNFGPKTEKFDYYDTVTRLHKNWIYQFNIMTIGKIVFKEKHP